MLESPWSFLLTITFLLTAVLCTVHLAQSRSAPGSTVDADRAHAAHVGPVATTVHVNHLVMSLAMLLMVWRPVGPAGTWAQVVLFALFSAAMVLGLPVLRGARDRVGLAGHLVLNAAMIWMLLAMPILMGHSAGGSHDAHAAHHAGEVVAEAPAIPTPLWAVGVNWAAVILSALVAAWWLGCLVRTRSHRIHAACHLLMGAGMALMLAVM